MQLLDGRRDAAILVAGVDAEPAQALEVRDVLVDHRERRVRRQLGHDVVARLAVPRRQVEEERRIGGVRRPRGQ